MELGESFLDVGTVGQVSWARRQVMVQAAKVVQMMMFTLLVIAVTLVVLRGSSSIASCTRSSVAEAGANDNNIKSMSHNSSSSSGNRIPSTLDGPFVPVTIPLDPSIRLSASQDLPQYDPRVVKRVAAIYPEQIFLSLSTPDAMWVSWVTGTY